MSAAHEQFDQAQLLQWQWKTEPMSRMAVAIVQIALAKEEFAADDLPQTMEHGGTGVAGSIFARLEQNGIIKRVGNWIGKDFYGKERASKREGRKAAKLKVYALADRPKAESFLRAKHAFKELRQAELIAA